MATIPKDSKQMDKNLYYLNKLSKSFETPQSLKTEHEELHSDLKKILELGGEVGKSAERVVKVLHPHFLKEEEYATPPLGLLKLLVKDNLDSSMEDAIAMSRKLKADLTEMKEEHKQIVNALNDLVNIARKDNSNDVRKFAEKLILHAQNEEEILYPTAILVGEYLKLKLFK